MYCKSLELGHCCHVSESLLHSTNTRGGYEETDEREERTGERRRMRICALFVLACILCSLNYLDLFTCSCFQYRRISYLHCTVSHGQKGGCCFEVLADWLCMHDDGWGHAGWGWDGTESLVLARALPSGWIPMVCGTFGTLQHTTYDSAMHSLCYSLLHSAILLGTGADIIVQIPEMVPLILQITNAHLEQPEHN
jgi:hypothetical protein